MYAKSTLDPLHCQMIPNGILVSLHCGIFVFPNTSLLLCMFPTIFGCQFHHYPFLYFLSLSCNTLVHHHKTQTNPLPPILDRYFGTQYIYICGDTLALIIYFTYNIRINFVGFDLLYMRCNH